MVQSPNLLTFHTFVSIGLFISIFVLYLCYSTMIGNLYGNGSIEVSTRLNSKNVIVASKNEHKHELSAAIRFSTGGGGRGGGGFSGGSSQGGGFGGGGGGKGGGGTGGKGKGGGGMGGGGKGFGGGVAGGAAGGIIGGGIVGGAVANRGHNGGRNGTDHSATTLSAGPHFCVSTLILCMSFWL